MAHVLTGRGGDAVRIAPKEVWIRLFRRGLFRTFPSPGGCGAIATPEGRLAYRLHLAAKAVAA